LSQSVVDTPHDGHGVLVETLHDTRIPHLNLRRFYDFRNKTNRR